MKIKDISVSIERLEDVRGGQYIDVVNAGLQIGGNSAYSAAGSVGLGNSTTSSVSQFAPQSFAQTTGIVATELDSEVIAVSDSWIAGYFR